MPAQGPLLGVRVLDLSRILAGPYCTAMLSDMGAEVIKVEPPGAGDDTRLWGPPFRRGESAYFLSVNRGKKSIVVDLKREAGREVARALAARADVLVENYRPGVAGRLGVGWEALSAANPRLVYVSISGFGQDGPYRDRAGFDLVAQAMSGIMSATGEPGGGPCKVGVPVSDLAAGMWAAFGAVSALLARERTGRGQRLDVALLDGSVALLANLAGNYFMEGQVAGRWGSAHGQVVPYQALRAKDKAIVVGTATEKFWRALCEVLGEPALAADPRFSDLPRRAKNRGFLIPLLEARLAQRTAAEWLRLLEARGIPCGPVHDVGEVLEDPHVRARGMVVETEHPLLGQWKVTGLPLKLSGTPGAVQSAPPLHGQHTREILSGLLGYDAAKIESLYAAGAVADPAPRDEGGRPAGDV